MVKKRSGTTAFPIIIIILLIGFVTYGFTTGLFTPFTQEFEGGGDITAISNIDISTAIPGFEGKAYLINVIANKGGQSLSAVITPETFAEFGINPSDAPTDDFKIEIDIIENFCDYQIEDDSFVAPLIYQASVRNSLVSCGDSQGLADTCPLSGVDLQDVINNCKGTYKRPDLGFGGTDFSALSGVGKSCTNLADPNCNANPHFPESCGLDFEPQGTENAIIGASPPLDGFNVCDSIIDLQPLQDSAWCYASPPSFTGGTDGDHWRVTRLGQAPIYQGFRIGDTSFNKFKVNITLTNGEGQQFSAIISQDQIADEVQGVLKAKWVGSLVGLQSCPIPTTNTNIVKNLLTEDFKEVDKNDYDGSKDQVFELVNLDNNFFASSGTDPGVGFADITSRVSSNNARVTAMFFEGDVRPDCYIVPGTLQYRCEPQNDVIFPELTLTVKADAITVVIPLGIPIIESISVPESFEGTINQLGFSLTNEGESDTFNVYADCGTPDIDVTSKKIPVGAGDTVEGILEVNGPIGEFDCILKAQSINSLESDEKSFSITFQQKPLNFEVAQPIQGIKQLSQIQIALIIALIIAIILIILGITFRKKIFKKRGKRR